MSVFWVRYLCKCVSLCLRCGEKASRSYLNTDSYIQLLLAPHTYIYRADQLSLEERRNALNLQREENKKIKKDKEKEKDKKRKKSKKKEYSACSLRQDIEFILRYFFQSTSTSHPCHIGRNLESKILT